MPPPFCPVQPLLVKLVAWVFAMKKRRSSAKQKQTKTTARDESVENTESVAQPKKRKLRAKSDETAKGSKASKPAVAQASASAAEKAKPAPAVRAPQHTSFSRLGLSAWLVQCCEKLGMRYPTEIQSMSIPPILAGRNVAGWTIAHVPTPSRLPGIPRSAKLS
eukprot:846163-Amphidinium_carterae.2